MSELEIRKDFAAEEFASPDAKTAELAPVAGYDPVEEYETGELEPQAGDADSDADLLALPPRADDLGAALAARPPRAKLPKVTTSLVAALLICGGFLSGVLVQKHLGASSNGRGGGNFSFAGGTRGGTGAGATGSGGGFFGRGGTGTGGSGSGTGTGTGGAGGGAITGKVTVVSGNTLYVTAADGSVYTVTTTGTTTVKVTAAGSLSQLKPGQTVVIAGSSDNNGNVTATSITANGTTPSGN
jgi:hypothetical protein